VDEFGIASLGERRWEGGRERMNEKKKEEGKEREGGREGGR
jgi:hypothetical protein